METGVATHPLKLERAVPGWFRRLARETGAFTVQSVSRADSSEDSSFDVAIRVRPAAGRQTILLLVEVKTRVTPQELLGLLPRLRELRRRGHPVLCSPLISPRVAELCREHGIGYLDAVGNCNFGDRGLFLHIEGRESRVRNAVRTGDPFALKSSRITRLLLSDPHRLWQLQELARDARVSLGLASRVKTRLVQEALAEIREHRVTVRDPAALLNAWAKRYDPPQGWSMYVMEEATRLEHRIAEWCNLSATAYALAGFSGAWHVAPMVRPVVSTVYVDLRDEQARELFMKQVSAREVPSGGNLTLWIPPDDYTLYGSRELGGLTVVSPLQLYLDLSSMAGRGAEAAREVFDKEIRPRW
jgi:hypothetical protein